MMSDYVTTTGRSGHGRYPILERGIASTEVSILFPCGTCVVVCQPYIPSDPYTGRTYSMAGYAVNNSAPRPVSYHLEDHETVHNPTLSIDSPIADLYSELASRPIHYLETPDFEYRTSETTFPSV